MNSEPVIVDVADVEWETWAEADIAARGSMYWKTLLSSEKTPSAGMTLGVAELPPQGIHKRHRHPPAEIYFILAGQGVMEIDGQPRPVQPGIAIFIPGNTPHQLSNNGSETLRLLYAFPTDSFNDVEYFFDAAAT